MLVEVRFCFWLTSVGSPLTSHHGSIRPTAPFILHDTSLAAVSSSDGNRYLFFQDPTGLIRGLIRTDNQWSTNFNLAHRLKREKLYRTPLAAIAANVTPATD